MSCKQEAKQNFSSSDVFELAPPQLRIDSILFKDSAKLEVNFEVENAKIYYSTDGSDVDETSIVYEKPILAKESGIYNFKAYHPEYKSSKQISATLIKTNYSLAAAETTISPPTHINYTANGPLSLIDFKKGSTQFRNGNEWLGFQSPVVTFNLDFPRRVEISKITLSTLRDHNSWIFLPKSIEVSNKTKQIGSLDINEPNQSQETKLSFIHIPIKKDFYANLEIQVHLLEEIPSWHQGKGTTPFFFIDEILVE